MFMIYGKYVVRTATNDRGEVVIVASDLCRILKIESAYKMSKRVSKENFQHVYIQHPQSSVKTLKVSALTVAGFKELINTVSKKNPRFRDWAFNLASQLESHLEPVSREEVDELINHIM